MSKPEAVRTSKGDIMLARYAVEGDGMLSDPEIQGMIAMLRGIHSFYTTLEDSQILERLMKTLAAVGGHDGAS